LTTVNLTTVNLTLTDLNELMGNTNKFMVALFMFLTTLFFLILFIFFAYWLFKKGGVNIQPFEVGICSEKYNGRAISDLLISGLLKIRRIHAFDPTEIKFELKGDLDLPPIVPSSENPNYDIRNLNISGGPFAISLGQFLMVLKQFIGRPENTVTGSLQKYGSKTKLMAWMGPEKIYAWEAENEVEDIPFLITELAFMIAKDLSERGIQAKTWQGFMYFTEALNWYRQYITTGDEVNLGRSKDSCFQALGAEKDYREPVHLLYAIGTTYNNKDKNREAKDIFSQILTFIPDANSPEEWSIRGTIFWYAGKYDEAVKAFDKAIELDPKFKRGFNSKGAALHNQGKHDEAIKAYDEAIRLDPSYAEAWNNKGCILRALDKTSEADAAFAKAKELGYTG
jgi:tetratricopeptide (TPR) repeat protein